MTKRINDNGVDRDMTADELAEFEALCRDLKAQAQAADAKAAAVASGRAKLAALGLTDAEIAAFFGA